MRRSGRPRSGLSSSGAERAQADLDAALRAFEGFEDEAAARERLTELRAVRDQAVEHAGHLSGLHSVARLRVAADWDRLTLDEQRGFIRATVERVTVAPGRGTDRIAIHL